MAVCRVPRTAYRVPRVSGSTATADAQRAHYALRVATAGGTIAARRAGQYTAI